MTYAVCSMGSRAKGLETFATLDAATERATGLTALPGDVTTVYDLDSRPGWRGQPWPIRQYSVDPDGTPVMVDWTGPA